MITKEFKKEYAENIMHSSVQEYEGVFKHALTAGQLIERLQKFDPNLPVALTHMSEIDDDGSIYENVDLLVDVVDTGSGTQNWITLESCDPKSISQYETMTGYTEPRLDS